AAIVCDVYAFNWSQPNRMHEQHEGRGYLEQLLGNGRALANFFHQQEGLFRVHFTQGRPFFLNIGDAYGVQVTGGQAATNLPDYHVLTFSRVGQNLLNARYTIAPSQQQQEGNVVYESGQWKVYERAGYAPRAWVVAEAVVEPSVPRVLQKIDQAGFDPL